MRVASILICDIIEKMNCFKDAIDTDKEKGGVAPSILVFLPGLHEIM